MQDRAIQSVHEPALRMAIAGIDIVIYYHLDHLPEKMGGATDDVLDLAITHLELAKDYLREWADLTGIEIQSGMKT